MLSGRESRQRNSSTHERTISKLELSRRSLPWIEKEILHTSDLVPFNDKKNTRVPDRVMHGRYIGGERSAATFSSPAFTDRSISSLYPTAFVSRINQIHHLADFSFDRDTRVTSLEGSRSLVASRLKPIGARPGHSYFEVAHRSAGPPL